MGEAEIGGGAAGGILGVLMLDTHFPRVVGDIGNPATFAFAVSYSTVRGASPERVVRRTDDALLAPFIAAGNELVGTGASAIATSRAFQRTLLNDEAELDVAEARQSTVAAALKLVANHPEVGAIVLECTNMPPYAAAVRAATGLPVPDITTLIASRFGPGGSKR